MEKKIYKDIKINKYTGIVLILIILSVYTYYFPETINGSDIKKIEVKLMSKPDYGAFYENNKPTITFKAKGYFNSFIISSCAYSLINKQDILNLNIGDSLTLKVNKNDLVPNENQFDNHPIKIVGIELKGKGVILSFEDYNSCESEIWKDFLFWTIIFLIILEVMILRRVAKNYKNNG